MREFNGGVQFIGVIAGVKEPLTSNEPIKQIKMKMDVRHSIQCFGLCER